MKISYIKYQISNIRGQTLVELILVMGLAALVLPALLTGFVAARNGKPQQQQRVQAISVLKESEAAIKNIRNNSWNTIASTPLDTPYHTEISGSQWSLVSGSFKNSNNITQDIRVNEVRRDSEGAIVATGGSIDPSTKKIDIHISWQNPYVSSIDSTLYLTRTKNQTFTQTNLSDFNAGVPTGTDIVATGGSATDGQVQLTTTGGGNGSGGNSGGPLSDWCAPNLSITAVDLPKNGVANTISAIEGKVFAGTGDNASGVSYASVAVTNTNPPIAAVSGTFNGYKTNGVFGETGFAYLATDNNAKEVVIVSQSGTPSEVGYFNAPGNGSGNSVYVSGNVGYMTSADKFYTFDLSLKSNSRPQKGVYTLAAAGNKIMVVGSYAYIANNSTTNQLEIVDVSNPNSPTLKKRVSVAGQVAKDVYVNSTGTRAYLATAFSSTQKEMFVIDISDKSNPVVLGSYDASGMDPLGITVIERDNKAILVGT
ncbi:MAG TPA: hypothetical protein VLG67_00900, partial [Candidatus Saccharimonadales bacterium]|nr:hypothetical protein [Candidatus Saccharimonadales bacterium]